MPVARPFLLATQRPVQAGDLVQFSLEKLRAVVFVAFVVGQECLQSEVKTAAVTRAGFNWFGEFHDNRETE